MRQAAFIYDDALSRHVLREDHVMRPTRLRYTHELANAYGLFERSQQIAPRHATLDELAWFHTPDYLRAVEVLSQGMTDLAPERYNFSEVGDNPPYEGMFGASTLSTGGSLVAAELVAAGDVEVAFNVAGGLHHAASDHASGFCIFNDPVIAIEALRRKGLRVMYVDIDCHHGDGVQGAFYDTNDVLTLSMHESGRYLFPGTGEVRELGVGEGKGFSVNVPLAPHTDDEIFHWAFDAVVPPIVDAFVPDVLVTQLGMDTHFDDPITHLEMTVQGHGEAVRKLGQMTKKWVALGGGGYDMSAVARGWCLDFGLMMGEELPDEIPSSYRNNYGLIHLRDDASTIGVQHRKVATEFVESSVAEVRRLIFPIHRLA